jgi:hypothetical protein
VVATAGADLKNPIARLNTDQIKHLADDMRRADRLVVADRQGSILVGLLLLIVADELVARNRAKGGLRARLRDDIVGNEAIDQPVAGGRHLHGCVIVQRM